MGAHSRSSAWPSCRLTTQRNPVLNPTDMKSILRIHLAILTCVVVAVLSGCGTTSVQQQQVAPVGQQLQELDKAYKDGIISQKEYERLKKAIIKKND